MSPGWAIPKLAGLLGARSPALQSTVSIALEQFGEAAVSQPAVALQDKRWQVRQHGAEALGMIGTPSAVPILAAALINENSEVRFAAIMGLRQIGSPEAHRAARAAADDDDPRVRAMAVRP